MNKSLWVGGNWRQTESSRIIIVAITSWQVFAPPTHTLVERQSADAWSSEEPG